MLGVAPRIIAGVNGSLQLGRVWHADSCGTGREGLPSLLGGFATALRL